MPLLLLRYLSLRYEQRRQTLQLPLKEPESDYFTGDPGFDFGQRIFGWVQGSATPGSASAATGKAHEG